MAAKRTGCAPTVVRDRTTHQRPRGKLPHATSFVGGATSHRERGRSTRGARSEEGAARRWVGGGSREEAAEGEERERRYEVKGKVACWHEVGEKGRNPIGPTTGLGLIKRLSGPAL